VLLANNDSSEFSARFPSDAEKVCALLQAQRPDWTYEAYSVKDEVFPSPEAADGFVITGSPASVHEPLNWIARLAEFIRVLHDRQVPLVGLCFGHQLIAKALGGEVARNAGGWKFGIAETIFDDLRPWMRPEVRRLRLHACHSEQVTRLPQGADRLGGDSGCPIGSFAVGQHIFTTEYHPEFTSSFMCALADAYKGEVPEAVLKAGRKQLEGEVQSDIFAQWMVQFFSYAVLAPSIP
jgi:GMP synthase-like glutamine amidotransferase